MNVMRPNKRQHEVERMFGQARLAPWSFTSYLIIGSYFYLPISIKC